MSLHISAKILSSLRCSSTKPSSKQCRSLERCAFQCWWELGNCAAKLTRNGTARAAASPPVLDLAASTAALVAMAHAAARAPGLTQLKLTVMPTNARGGQGVVRGQHASALLARVMAALQATLAANGMLRCALGTLN